MLYRLTSLKPAPSPDHFRVASKVKILRSVCSDFMNATNYRWRSQGINKGVLESLRVHRACELAIIYEF